MRKYKFIIIYLVALFSLVGWTCNTDMLQPTTEDVSVQSGIPAPIEEYFRRKYDNVHLQDTYAAHLAYYTKYIGADGVWIMGNGDYLRDEQFYATRKTALLMTSKRPEIHESLAQRHGQGFRMILLSASQPPDPERGYRVVPDYPHSKGKLGWCLYRACVSTIWWKSESQREGPDKINMQLQVFRHEFAHAMDEAIDELDPTFDDRLEAAYQDALIPTHSVFPEGDYALINKKEYWAVFVSQYWFGKTPRFMNIVFKPENNNDLLMIALCEEWLPQIYLRPLEYMEEPVEWEWEWETDESE